MPHSRDLAQEVIDRSLVSSMTPEQVFELLGPPDSSAIPADLAPGDEYRIGFSVEATHGVGELDLRFLGGRVAEAELH